MTKLPKSKDLKQYVVNCKNRNLYQLAPLKEEIQTFIAVLKRTRWDSQPVFFGRTRTLERYLSRKMIKAAKNGNSSIFFSLKDEYLNHLWDYFGRNFRGWYGDLDYIFQDAEYEYPLIADYWKTYEKFVVDVGDYFYEDVLVHLGTGYKLEKRNTETYHGLNYIYGIDILWNDKTPEK